MNLFRKVVKPGNLLLISVLNLVFGYLIIAPSSILFPKNKKSMVFIGRDDGRFIDNVKYMYLYCYNQEAADIVPSFITHNRILYNEMKDAGFNTVLHPSLKSYWVLLRAPTVIVDNWMWVKKFKFHLLMGAKKVQLWHGVGFKKIEFGVEYNLSAVKKACLSIYNKLLGRYPKYDILVTTSDFYKTSVFEDAFKALCVESLGYPRNDIFYDSDRERALFNSDICAIDYVSSKRKNGTRVVFYAPTWRENGGDAFTSGNLDLSRLSSFAEENNILFVFKFHPDPNFQYNISEHEYIVQYNNSLDVYPLIPLVDCLITDYSSIYMDYLHLDRPILFFPYDHEEYVVKSNNIQFDYDWITPGPKCFTQKELENSLINLLKHDDTYIQQRQKIRNIAFKYSDGHSAKRIFQRIVAEGLEHEHYVSTTERTNL